LLVLIFLLNLSPNLEEARRVADMRNDNHDSNLCPISTLKDLEKNNIKLSKLRDELFSRLKNAGKMIKTT